MGFFLEICLHTDKQDCVTAYVSGGYTTTLEAQALTPGDALRALAEKFDALTPEQIERLP